MTNRLTGRLAALFAFLPLIGLSQSIPVPDAASLRSLVFQQTSAPGSVYQLNAGVYTLPANTTAVSGRLTGSPSAPITVRGAGRDATIIECPNVCYIEPNSHFRFEDLTIRGAVNSQGLNDVTLLRVRMDDPSSIGSLPGRIMWKTASGAVSASAIRFLSSQFDRRHAPNAGDYVLDLIGVQGAVIEDNEFWCLGNGCFQSKGGSGILAAWSVQRNRVYDAGARGMQFGGSAGTNAFNPPLVQAGAEFGSALVRDNWIVGGGACASFISTRGPIDFRNNICVGQTQYQVRFANENAAVVSPGGVTFSDNIFAAGSPVNGHVGGGSLIDWPSVMFDRNVWTYNPPLSAIPAGAVVGDTVSPRTISLDSSGMPVIPADLSADGYGPSAAIPTPSPTPGSCFSYISHVAGSAPTEHSSLQEAIDSAASSVKIYKAVSFVIDVEAGTVTGQLEQIPVSVVETNQ